MPIYSAAESCEVFFTEEALAQIKTSQFEIDNNEERNNTAIKLLSCIGHPNAAIRDGIVYEGLSQWLRQAKLETATVKSMYSTLLQNLNAKNAENKDTQNFTQPFSALVFSEVVRVDRVTPYLSPEERTLAVNTSVEYMNSIVDYRGFDDNEGWRHSVAHTADIFLQLALNKNISKNHLSKLMSAIQNQVSPQNAYFYVHGEPKRLAMAFIYILLRGEHSTEELNRYFAALASPSPFNTWGEAYTSNIGLAKLHNTRAFVYSLYAISGASENPHLMAIQSKLRDMIKLLA